MTRRFEQIFHHIFGRACARARDAEVRAAPLHRYRHAVFDQAQVFIERAAEVCEPRVVRGHEIEFARRFDGSGSGHQLAARRCTPAGITLMKRPRSDCGRASTMTTSTK